MKPEIHPHYELTAVHCACGATFQTRSTKKDEIHVDICSMCHRFTRANSAWSIPLDASTGFARSSISPRLNPLGSRGNSTRRPTNWVGAFVVPC